MFILGIIQVTSHCLSVVVLGDNFNAYIPRVSLSSNQAGVSILEEVSPLSDSRPCCTAPKDSWAECLLLGIFAEIHLKQFYPKVIASSPPMDDHFQEFGMLTFILSEAESLPKFGHGY